MKEILVTGATGNIGRALCLDLIKNKLKVTVVTRDIVKARKLLPFPVKIIEWDLSRAKIPSEKIEDIDVVINLAKESLITNALTKRRQRHILESAVSIAKNLTDSFANEVYFIHFSGTSCYKSSLFPVTENSPLEDGFYGDLAAKTEACFENYRSTIIRIPLVLSPNMPIIKRLICLYRFMVAPRVLSKNVFSWVHQKDINETILKMLIEDFKPGLINLVAGSVGFKDFHKTFCELTGRINPFVLPSFFIKKLFKQKAQMLLTNSEVHSVHSSFLQIKFKSLEEALTDCLNVYKSPNLKRAKFHYRFETYQFLPKKIDLVFDFFKEAKNLERITPKNLNFKITHQSTSDIEEGTRFDYELKLNGIPFKWTTFIENWNPPLKFTDYQTKGPYNVWYHTHMFYELEEGTLMVDEVKYRLPLGLIGDIFGLWFVKKNVKEIFRYRYKYIEEEFKNE